MFNRFKWNGSRDRMGWLGWSRMQLLQVINVDRLRTRLWEAILISVKYKRKMDV